MFELVQTGGCLLYIDGKNVVCKRALLDSSCNEITMVQNDLSEDYRKLQNP